jgi:putative transcriptional regulator
MVQFATVPDSLKGHLLIASPKLRDPNFFRSVVLLVQHDERGSLGLVLNRPMELTIREAWKQLSEMPCQVEGNLHKGGPCEGVLMALHTDLEASDVEVFDGVHFSTTKDAIEHLVSHTGGSVRLFVGYAGWSPGQLENELTEGAWVTAPATSESIFNMAHGSWEQLLRSIGRANLSQIIDPKILPEDPSVN